MGGNFPLHTSHDEQYHNYRFSKGNTVDSPIVYCCFLQVFCMTCMTICNLPRDTAGKGTSWSYRLIKCFDYAYFWLTNCHSSEEQQQWQPEVSAPYTIALQSHHRPPKILGLHRWKDKVKTAQYVLKLKNNSGSAITKLVFILLKRIYLTAYAPQM